MSEKLSTDSRYNGRCDAEPVGPVGQLWRRWKTVRERRGIASLSQAACRRYHVGVYVTEGVNNSSTGLLMTPGTRITLYGIPRPVALRPSVHTRRVLGRVDTENSANSAGHIIEIHTADHALLRVGAPTLRPDQPDPACG